MKLIFLHGPPASGKLTIAKAISAKTGLNIFHNHLTIDAARPFFEFGTNEFWDLVRELRLACFRAAAGSVETVIYTNCYDHPSDLPFFEKMEEIVMGSGGEVIPVFLQCDVAELENRVSASSRVELGKINTVDKLRNYMSAWNCAAIPRRNCLTVVTDKRSAEECAEILIERLDLV